MTRLHVYKSGGGDLLGCDPKDQDYLARMKPGEALECDVRRARNPGQHRKFFALFDASFHGQSKYTNPKDLMRELKIRAGWYDEYITQGGKVVYVPKSLSWGTMGDDEFKKFYDEAVTALAEMFGNEEVVMEADDIIARTGT